MGQVIFFYLSCLSVYCFSLSFCLYITTFFDSVLKNFLEQLANKSTTMHNSISEVIKSSDKISLTKNIILPEQNIQTSIVTTKKLGYGRNTRCIWPKYEYFQQQPCDFHMDKENYPEKSVIYLKQGYLRVKDNKKMYYADFHMLGQIKKCINPPEDIQNYLCKEREVKMYRSHYDPVSCQFLDLYESLGVIVANGDYSDHFLD